MEVAERAQDHEAAEWLARQNRATATTFKPDEAGYGPAWCSECDEEPISALRREMGCTRCVACQSIKEADDKRRGRR